MSFRTFYKRRFGKNSVKRKELAKELALFF